MGNDGEGAATRRFGGDFGHGSGARPGRFSKR
jgi:hypothetical protein